MSRFTIFKFFLLLFYSVVHFSSLPGIALFRIFFSSGVPGLSQRVRLEVTKGYFSLAPIAFRYLRLGGWSVSFSAAKVSWKKVVQINSKKIYGFWQFWQSTTHILFLCFCLKFFTFLLCVFHYYLVALFRNIFPVAYPDSLEWLVVCQRVLLRRGFCWELLRDISTDILWVLK